MKKVQISIIHPDSIDDSIFEGFQIAVRPDYLDLKIQEVPEPSPFATVK